MSYGPFDPLPDAPLEPPEPPEGWAGGWEEEPVEMEEAEPEEEEDDMAQDERWQTRLEAALGNQPAARALLQAGLELERLRARTGGLLAVVGSIQQQVNALSRGLADLEADLARMDEALDTFATQLTEA